MISKRVFINAGNDNYARLAAYIADAGPAGEKCLMNWCEGMLGGDDYAEGIAEAKDVQARNTRAASKTYHLVISFRPEDEARLHRRYSRALKNGSPPLSAMPTISAIAAFIRTRPTCICTSPTA